MPTYRRHAVVLVLLLGIVALVAQLAGVGGTRPNASKPAPRAAKLATIPGGSVPDIASTKLATRTIRAEQGETVQMRGTARLTLRRLASGSSAQVVCGLRYVRNGDRSWSLGTPYETVTLTKSDPVERVAIERSFAAPATDTYRVTMACHVASPARGATVTATGSSRLQLGLPAGAATPVE